MSRLIDADELIKAYDREHKGEPGRARQLMVEAPTVDAVEVVRCKFCKYSRRDSDVSCLPYMCTYTGFDDYNNAEHFCAYGERRER